MKAKIETFLEKVQEKDSELKEWEVLDMKLLRRSSEVERTMQEMEAVVMEDKNKATEDMMQDERKPVVEETEHRT